MNRLMAILFLMGACGAFGLSQRDSYQSQPTTRYGAPAGPVTTVPITKFDRVFYIAFGMGCAAACLYFVDRIRREDLRK